MKLYMLTASILTFIFTISHAETINYLLSGVDYEKQSGYYDANKLFDGNDDVLCWAFAASNQLQYWQDRQNPYIIEENRIPDGYSGKQEMYSLDIAYTFASAWKNNAGGIEKDGFEWWISGKPVDEFLLLPGGYWKDYVKSGMEYVEEIDLLDTEKGFLFDNLFPHISCQDGLCLSIIPGRDEGGHALTLWGYGLDTDLDSYWVYISDSDDKKTELLKVGIEYMDIEQEWRIADSSSEYDTYIVQALTYFSLSIPEPSTYAIFVGIFALGFAIQRKRK